MSQASDSLTQVVPDSQTPQLNTFYAYSDDELCQLAARESGKHGDVATRKAAVAELIRRADLQKAIDAMSSKVSRRSFLVGILATGAAMAAPKPTEAESLPDSDFAQRKPPYPDPERQAVVDRFIRKIDDCLIPIERLYSCLLDWNEQYPDQVDGFEVMQLLWDCKTAADELASTIECGDLDHNADELVTRLSGKPLAYLCIVDEIKTGILEGNRAKAEIDSLCEDYPQYRQELESLLAEVVQNG